jgi:hypothetical protein
MRCKANQSCRRPARAGFTLLEAVIGSVLLAAVVVTTFLFVSSSRSFERVVRERIERNEGVRLAFEQIERALVSCLPAGGVYAEGLTATGGLEGAAGADEEEAPGGSMSVVSAAGIGRLGGELRRVTFRFVPPAGEEFDTEPGAGPPSGRLMMSVSAVGRAPSTDEGLDVPPEDAAAGETAELLGGLADVRFAFFDGTEWVPDVWDAGGLPLLVRVELWFHMPPEGEAEPIPAGAVVSRTFRVIAANAGDGGGEGGGRVLR